MLSDLILLVLLLSDAPAAVFRALGILASSLALLTIALSVLLRRVAAIEVKPCPHCGGNSAAPARSRDALPPRQPPPPNPTPRKDSAQ